MEWQKGISAFASGFMKDAFPKHEEKFVQRLAKTAVITARVLVIVFSIIFAVSVFDMVTESELIGEFWAWGKMPASNSTVLVSALFVVYAVLAARR